MKQSTILFLLLFTLATSADIEINPEPGLYIWNISDNWNDDLKYVRIDQLNNSTDSISQSFNSHFDVPGSSTLQWDTPVLNTFNTYIVLEITNFYKIYLFYWVGAHSSEKKRINAAHSAGFIFKNEILKKMPERNLEAFNREPERAESWKFKSMFKLYSGSGYNTRLYRVAGSRGQLIREVSLRYDELNDSDSFVLEKYKKVLIWNSYYSNEFKKRQAEALSRRIIESDRMLKYNKSNVLCMTSGYFPVDKETYNMFRKEFFEVLEGVPENKIFPRIPRTPANYSDEELENSIKENLVLYEYDSFLNRVMERKVKWAVLTFNSFVITKTYVLVDFYNGNVFPVLGYHARTEQIKIALSAAEKILKTTGVENATKRVKIIRMQTHLATCFAIYFRDVVLSLYTYFI